MLPFRDFSFLTDEDDIAFLEDLEEGREQEEQELEKEAREWPSHHESLPLPPLPNLYWDHLPPSPPLARNYLLLLLISLPSPGTTSYSSC